MSENTQISCASFSRYVLNLMDTYGAGFAVIWIALWEVICLMWIYGVCNFSKVTTKFCKFLWKLFIPGHITDDWLATVYSDQSLLGFCLSCCPAGEINFKALSFFNCKRESVFIMHVTTGYIHPLPGLLEYAPLQPNGKKAVPLFVPSLKYYSWSLYCLLSCNICHLPMFCIKNQKLIDVFMASSVVKFVTSRYFVFTL